MADIEKGLPTEVRTEIKVPGEDIEVKEEIQEKDQ